MKKTTLQDKRQIKALLAQGQSYSEIAASLGLSERVTRKWGQVIKKRRFLGTPNGST